MAEDSLLREAIEGMIREGSSEGDVVKDKEVLSDWDLPRIVVGEDYIVVLEDDKFKIEEEVDEVEDKERVLDLDFVLSSLDFLDSQDSGLEGLVPRSERVEVGDDFYKVSGDSRNFYDRGDYDEGGAKDYDGMVERVDVVDVEELRRGGRSMLEIAGFKDFEAEERREKERVFRA